VFTTVGQLAQAVTVTAHYVAEFHPLAPSKVIDAYMLNLGPIFEFSLLKIVRGP